MSVQNLLENLEDSLKLNSDSKILGLYANEELISLAGIETLKLYKPNKMTEQFLIEGSIFNSKLIRQTSRKIGLRTSRSARYEKRINNSEFLLAISRLLELIKNINNQVKFKIHTKKFETSGHEIKIPLQLKNINEILGPIVSNVEPLDSISNNVVYLTEKLVYEYLTRLNFKLIIQKILLKFLIEKKPLSMQLIICFPKISLLLPVKDMKNIN